MPWLFTKYLQDTFDSKLYFQMTDDEKFLFNENLQLKDTTTMAYENALDVIALGFDPKKTKIMVDTEVIKTLYPLALKVAKRITFSTAKAVFGFDNSTNIGTIYYTSHAGRAVLHRERAGRQEHSLPHPLRDRPGPALPGDQGRRATARLLQAGADPQQDVPGADRQRQDVLLPAELDDLHHRQRQSHQEEGRHGVHRRGGVGRGAAKDRGQAEVCSVFKYQYYLFEKDDKAMDDLSEKCRRGEILCGECKKMLADKIVKFLEVAPAEARGGQG